MRGADVNATLTVCSAVTAIVGISLQSSRSPRSLLAFASCHELLLPASTSVAVLLLTSSHGVTTASAPIAVFPSNNGRNYAVVYGLRGSLALLAPSPSFNESLPVDFNRFVWASLCEGCGPMSAYVSDFRKRIGDRPISCGTAVDETEGPPGPPTDAEGFFTAFTPAGAAPGRIVAPVCFPWTRAQYASGEPLQLLLAPNLSMVVLAGYAPRVFNASTPGFTCRPPR
jgi:hypothetical protein